MLNSQRQIMDGPFTVQEAIEQELKAIDDLLRSHEWSAFSEAERQRRSLRARIAVMDRILEREEVVRHKPLFQSLAWQRHMYQYALNDLLAQPEHEAIDRLPAPVFVPASQEQIDAVLNPPRTTGFLGFFKFLWEIPTGNSDWLIEALEIEINDIQRKPRSKEWERLTDTQKQIWILEEKIIACERTIAAGVAMQEPKVLRHALRAKECYTNHLDALKMDLPDSQTSFRA